MNVRYYLRHPQRGKEESGKREDSQKATKRAIYALINYSGISVKYYIGESIDPRFWSTELGWPVRREISIRGRKKVGKGKSDTFHEYPEFTHRLDLIRTTINTIFLDHKNKYNTAPTRDHFKELINTKLSATPAKESFLLFFEDFVERTENGARSITMAGKKNGSLVRPQVAKGYRTTLNKLNEFAKTYKTPIDFDTIDEKFYTTFLAFLSSPPHSLRATTVGSHIQRIKAVLSDATEKKLNTNLFFKSKAFFKYREPADSIYLTESELDEMLRLDLSGSPMLENARDLFLFGVYSLQRYSDFIRIGADNFNTESNTITLIQKKTNTKVIIPIHPVHRIILKRRGGEFPKAISNQNLNSYLKEIGKLMPSLNEPHVVGYKKGGVDIQKSVQKWELLSSHTARRSGCSYLYNRGVPLLSIAQISGHSSEAMLKVYLKISGTEHAQKVLNVYKNINLRAV